MCARTGSGGVGFFIKNELFDVFEVSVLDNTTESILWLHLKHKFEKVSLLPCVCYLPPENSSRRVDVNVVFDTLLANIYSYQNFGTTFICGDFNGRCGDLEDFITGANLIGHRDVVDRKTNFYGEVLIDYFINTNMCILNGRNCINNDFTSISTKGLSVVDYCLVSHEVLVTFSNFIRAVDLINRVNDISNLLASSIPDHSAIIWEINLEAHINTCMDNDGAFCSTYFDKFDVPSVPSTFLSDQNTLLMVNEAINSLESSLRTQSDVDTAYEDWCGVLRKQMYLPYRTVLIGA